MKRYLVAAAVMTGILSGSFLISSRAQAIDTPMTEAHIARIRAHCVEAQSQLRQLHASDALLRVNRGQLYELISTKLMAPLNSRIALNRLGGASLVSTTAKYEKELAAFRLAYKEYEEAMTGALEIKCTDQPVTFYDRVKDARGKRKKVNETTTALHKTIKQYKTEFELFATSVEKANR